MTPEKNYTIKEIIYETNDYFFALPFSPHPIPLPLFILYFLSLNGRGQKVRVKKNNPLTQSLSRQGERENKGK